MKDKRSEREKLRKLLTEAYRAKENVPVDEQWQPRVMARIQEMAPVALKLSFLPAFERVVWRLVPLTLGITVGLIVLLVRLYLANDYDGLQLFANYVEELAVTQIYGT